MPDDRPLATFFQRLDAGLASEEGRQDLLALLAPDFRWEISLLDKVVGGDRADFKAFLEARAKANATAGGEHRVVLNTREDPLEIVYGVFEAGTDKPSPFVSAATIDQTGQIARFMHRRSDMDM